MVRNPSHSRPASNGCRLPRVSRSMTEKLHDPTLDQVLEFCSRDPIERVFLEDVARRGYGRFVGVDDEGGLLVALCHLGANLVPSGYGCGAFAEAAAGCTSKMMI